MAPVVDVDLDKVLALKLPKSVGEELDKHFERRGTLLDRDYELSREGTGFDTEYYVIADDPQKRNLKRYDIPDLEAILDQVINGTDEEPEEERPKRRRSKTTSKEEEPRPRRSIKSKPSSTSDRKPRSVSRSKPTEKTTTTKRRTVRRSS